MCAGEQHNQILSIFNPMRQARGCSPCLNMLDNKHISYPQGQGVATRKRQISVLLLLLLSAMASIGIVFKDDLLSIAASSSYIVDEQTATTPMTMLTRVMQSDVEQYGLRPFTSSADGDDDNRQVHFQGLDDALLQDAFHGERLFFFDVFHGE